MSISLNVDGQRSFRELSRDLAAAGRGDLRKRLRQEIRAAGRPVVADVRRAALGSGFRSSRGGHAYPDRSTNLRKRIAAATQVSVTKRGIRIKVNARKVGEYGASLPRYLDATLPRNQRLRHPVFGNRDVWTQQRGQGFFFATINRHHGDFRRAVLAAMDRTIEELER